MRILSFLFLLILSSCTLPYLQNNFHTAESLGKRSLRVSLPQVENSRDLIRDVYGDVPDEDENGEEVEKVDFGILGYITGVNLGATFEYGVHDSIDIGLRAATNIYTYQIMLFTKVMIYGTPASYENVYSPFSIALKTSFQITSCNNKHFECEEGNEDCTNKTVEKNLNLFGQGYGLTLLASYRILNVITPYLGVGIERINYKGERKENGTLEFRTSGYETSLKYSLGTRIGGIGEKTYGLYIEATMIKLREFMSSKKYWIPTIGLSVSALF